MLVIVACSGKSADSPAKDQAGAPDGASKQAPEPEGPPPLSEEDKRLLAADPATLSPEERRKRAYALRRKVMQDPDSPAARTLTDLEEAVRGGEIDPNAKTPTLSLPGTKPQSGRPPAGWRPSEETAEGDASAPVGEQK